MSDDKFELSRRKILGATAAVGVAGAGAGVGTSALFSDEESFEDNEIQAGELDLIVDYVTTVTQDGVATGGTPEDGSPNTGTIQGGVSGEYQIADVKPGDSGFLAFCPKIVDNAGWLFVGSAGGVTDYENGQTEPEGDVDPSDGGNLDNGTNDGDPYGELSEAIQVDVEYCEVAADVAEPSGPEDYNTVRDFNNPADYTLADLFKELESGFLLDGDADPANGTTEYPSSPDQSTQNGPCLCISWELPAEVGNEVQSDAVEFDITFAARQWRNNPNPENPIATTTVWPGDSIQSAIDSASDGDVISVFGGSFGDGSDYGENLNIDKPLMLARASAEMPSIMGDSSALRTVTVTADDVTIDGFEITGEETAEQNFGVQVLPKSGGGTRMNFTLCNSRVYDLEAEGRATGLGINMDPSNLTGANAAPAENIDVYNCRFENIRCSSTDPGTGDGGVVDDRSKAKGIALVGDITDTLIRHVSVLNIGNGTTTFGRGVTATEGNATPSVGPKDFEIYNSEFSGMEGAFGNAYDGAAMFVGEYADFGASVVWNNNILSPVENFPNGTPPQSGNDVLSAPSNYWDDSGGPSGPGGSGGGVAVTENVEFTPVESSSLSDAGSTV